MPLLHGTLLSGVESFEWLKAAIDNSPPQSFLQLASAYLKAPVLEALLDRAQGRRGRFLVRWQKQDLVAGSSDLEAFSILSEAGWEMFVDSRFHGKVYLIPGSGVLVGSANATRSGFSLDIAGNKEICTVIQESYDAGSFISGVFDDAVKMSPELYEKIRNEIVENSIQYREASFDCNWSSEIISYLSTPTVSHLFTHDLFRNPPSADFLQNDPMDRALAGWLEPTRPPSNLISSHLSNLKVAHLLKRLGEESKEGVWFGELTSTIHDLLIDDPTPYRSTVKELVAATLEWMAKYCPHQFVIDRPRHSQRIRLISD